MWSFFSYLDGIFHESKEKEKDVDDDSEIADQLHLLESGDESDMTLQCEDQDYRVHSHILIARSDIFKLLIREYEEKRRLRITDIGPLALEKMLHYIYSGKVPSMSIQSAMKVYEAAENYLVEGLRRKCARIIQNKLNEANACDVLLFSDHLRGNYLKTVVITYICGKKAFLKSETWRDFSNHFPSLAAETFQAFIQRY